MKITLNLLLKSLSIIFLILAIYALFLFIDQRNNDNLLRTDKLVVRYFPHVAEHFQRGKPVDRFYIEAFLEDNKKYIKGSVLELESPTYTFNFAGGEITNSDVLAIEKENKYITMAHDMQDTDWFPSDKFDCFICTQTLQYIYDIKAGFKTAHKMLKEGGAFLVTAPGVATLSYKKPVFYEYWHFTEKTLYNLAKEAGFKEIKVQSFGNHLTTTMFLQGIAIEDLKNRELLYDLNEYCPTIVTLIAIK